MYFNFRRKAQYESRNNKLGIRKKEVKDKPKKPIQGQENKRAETKRLKQQQNQHFILESGKIPHDLTNLYTIQNHPPYNAKPRAS